MRKAANKGVMVRLIVPGPRSDHPWINHISRHFYTRLLKNNIQIYEYQPQFLHTKLVVCDNWINTGSCNLDRWNMRFNHDANVEVHDKTVISEVDSYLDKLLGHSQMIDIDSWQQRPAKEKIKEWFWSKVALWLERLTHR